jgi:hypothetical protein
VGYFSSKNQKFPVTHNAVNTGTSTSGLGKYDCLQLDGNAGLLEISVNGACCVIELTAI